MKNITVFVSENFKFLEENFSIYLNRRVFVMVLHVGRYRSRVLLSLSPIPGYDLEVKVTAFHIKVKIFASKFI